MTKHVGPDISAKLQCSLESVNGEDLIVQEDGVVRNIALSDVIAIIKNTPAENTPSERYTLLARSPTSSRPADNKPNGEPPKSFSIRSFSFCHLPSSLLDAFAIDAAPPYLSRSTTPDGSAPLELTIIVSVKSGTEEGAAFFQDVVQPVLSAIGITQKKYTVHLTDSERWISEYAQNTISPKANAGHAQTVILLSGDGGIVDTINSLFSKPQAEQYVKPTLGLLALGTGNALANSSGLNNDATRGLRTLLRGAPESIPTFKCTFSPGSVLLVDEARRTEDLPTDASGNGTVHGAVVASWGLHASLVADSDTAAYRKHGAQRFTMAASELLEPADGSESHRYKGRITTFYRGHGEGDGEGKEGKEGTEGKMRSRVWDGTEHMYVLATLVSNLQASVTISPESKPLDGVLRLMSWAPLPSEEVKGIFGMAREGGRHVQHPEVGYEVIDGLRIEFLEEDARWRRVCVDGKIVRVPEGGWVEVWREERKVADLVV